jgi:hypothetical protein
MCFDPNERKRRRLQTRRVVLTENLWRFMIGQIFGRQNFELYSNLSFSAQRRFYLRVNKHERVATEV